MDHEAVSETASRRDAPGDLATIVALPGTLCAPAVFEALRDRLRGVARVETVSCEANVIST